MSMSGFTPFLISWNITKRCNLRCRHCYLDSAELEGAGDLPTDEAFRFVDEIASLNPNSMVILTGGEPLLRPDCLDIAEYASHKGLTVVLGTNGTLLDDSLARDIKKRDVKGVGISLDSTTPAYHDSFRGLDGAWKKTIDAMDVLRRNGIDFQVQLTITRENKDELPGIIDLAHTKGARAVNLFFLVCTGRGQDMTDLTPQEYESVLRFIVEAEQRYEGRIMVRARCAPHVLRVARMTSPESSLLRGETSGCIAGTGYLRISPDGYVTPCPYIPVGEGDMNLRDRPLRDIWENSPGFRILRERSYDGRCRDCEFSDMCGGCRARALGNSGNLMGEDPWCEYTPGKTTLPETPVTTKPVWTREAEERLNRVPPFLRGMVKRGVERYAVSKGFKEITPPVLSELRRRVNR